MRVVFGWRLACVPVAVMAFGARADAFTYTVTGVIQWTDIGDNLHPARGVTLNLLDSAGTTTDATTTTDMLGNYTMSFSSLSPFGFTENLQIQAINAGGYVSSDATPGGTISAFPSSFTMGVGTNFINVTMQKTPADLFASPGFSVADALLTGYQYASAVRPAAPAALPALFPQPDKDGTFFSPGANDIHVIAQDRWDWDVTLHEYSHYLQKLDKTANNPGGSHAWGVSNIPGRGKDAGSRLAWGEGLANYEGVAAPFVAAANAANHVPANFPNVLDTHYQDTEDLTLDFNLASQVTPTAHGEGDELAVARIMWWIADGINGTTDRVSRGHVQVYKDTVAAAGAGTLQNLSQMNNYYLNTVATTDKVRTDYGAIFQANSVSPVPTDLSAITFPAAGPAPTFTWQRGNDGANETFHLMVWDDAGLTHRVINDFLIPGDVTTYTLTPAQWALLNTAAGTRWYDIIGADLKDGLGVDYAGISATGGYWSDAYSFAVTIPEPMAGYLLLLGAGGLWRRRR